MFDLHNHMLPGLDDGALDWNQSLQMARIAVEDGIEGIVCTPHWVLGYFENTGQRVLDAVETLREKLHENGIPLEVYPGLELRLDQDIPRKIREGTLLTINGTGRYALIELPEEVVPQHLRNFFWELQSENITPIIGHPERNRMLMHQPTRLQKWVEMGVLVQITAASLLGKFGSDFRKFSLSLLKHRMVHVVATDAHGTNSRTPRLSEALRELEKVVGKPMARQLVYDNPKGIIAGEPLTLYDPIPFKSRSPRKPFWKKVFSFLEPKQM